MKKKTQIGTTLVVEPQSQKFNFGEIPNEYLNKVEEKAIAKKQRANRKQKVLFTPSVRAYRKIAEFYSDMYGYDIRLFDNNEFRKRLYKKVKHPDGHFVGIPFNTVYNSKGKLCEMLNGNYELQVSTLKHDNNKVFVNDDIQVIIRNESEFFDSCSYNYK